MNIIFNIIGWVGALLILLAYLQAARNIWPTNGIISSIINGLGAIGLGAAAASHRSWPNVGMEIAFITIAIHTLIKNLKST